MQVKQVPEPEEENNYGFEDRKTNRRKKTTAGERWQPCTARDSLVLAIDHLKLSARFRLQNVKYWTPSPVRIESLSPVDAVVGNDRPNISLSQSKPPVAYSPPGPSQCISK